MTTATPLIKCHRLSGHDQETLMRVMVTGGRHYGSKIDGPFMIRDPEARAFLSVMLDDLHRNSPISMLIVGDASGADFLAYRWANERNVPVERYRADWRAHGKAAGPDSQRGDDPHGQTKPRRGLQRWRWNGQRRRPGQEGENRGS